MKDEVIQIYNIKEKKHSSRIKLRILSRLLLSDIAKNADETVATNNKSLSENNVFLRGFPASLIKEVFSRACYGAVAFSVKKTMLLGEFYSIPVFDYLSLENYSKIKQLV